MLQFLRETRLAAPDETPRAAALAGGVSSDIWRVDLARGTVCVKGALPRLRVSQVWEAPVERNRYEYEWLRIAGAAAPGAAPRVFAERFPTDAIFYAIRLEPYLIATGQKHPALRTLLERLAQRTARTKLCLVHGDVSPKNILVSARGPVFLDAECAWYGDPAFDLAFCLNHLFLKCLWVPSAALRFLECFSSLADAYIKGVHWEAPGGIAERTATLLPALLLARVDGKSPVEYLTIESDKNKVREFATRLLLHPAASLSKLKEEWQRSLM